jgi:2-phospho-L-lactate guanylyltransferase
MRTIAILPVKSFDAAKQRLTADVGEPQQRLAEQMVSRVLDALCAAKSIERVLVVTREPAAVRLAAALGAEIVDEPSLCGHSAAASCGVDRAIVLGAERVLLAAGDCPLLTARDVDDLLGRHTGHGVVVLADRHGAGTNGLLLAPPDAITPAFGPGSRERHTKLADEAGMPSSVESIQGFAIDVDTAEDLALVGSAIT